MTTHPSYEEEFERLLGQAYPGASHDECAEIRLDYELLARWLLKQVELENPALEMCKPQSDENK